VECRSHPSLPVVLPKLVDRIPGATLEEYSENGAFARFRLQCRGEDPRLEISKMLTEAGIKVKELAPGGVNTGGCFCGVHQSAPQRRDSTR